MGLVCPLKNQVRGRRGDSSLEPGSSGFRSTAPCTKLHFHPTTYEKVRATLQPYIWPVWGHQIGQRSSFEATQQVPQRLFGQFQKQCSPKKFAKNVAKITHLGDAPASRCLLR
jgi:hypothetical protein